MGDLFTSKAVRTALIPDELKPLLSGSAEQLLDVQRTIPLSAFAINTPQMTADLSNLQKYALGRTPELGMTEPGFLASLGIMASVPELTARPVPTPPAETDALRGIGWLTGGPLGTSPATVAGMQSWYNWVRPQVQNELALAGLGRSGALGSALAKSATEAAVPLLQQEVENRLAVLPMLTEIAKQEQARYLYPTEQTVSALRQFAQDTIRLGDATFNQQLRGILSQLEAGAIPRSVAEAQAERAYNDFLRMQALAEAATLGVFGTLAPSAIGFKATSTPSVMSQIGQSLQMLGSLAGAVGGLSAGSDPREKREVRPVDLEDEDILRKLDELPIRSWRYKPHNAFGADARKRHVGPMADDFVNLFDVEPIEVRGRQAVSAGDLFGTLVMAMRALNRKVDRLIDERDEPIDLEPQEEDDTYGPVARQQHQRE